MSSTAQDTLDWFRDSGETWLSPVRLAASLHMGMAEFANAVGIKRGILRSEPESELVQARLLGYCLMFLAVHERKPGINSACFHMRNTPIRTLGYRTLFEVVRDGDVEEGLNYLQSVTWGQVG